MERMPWAAAAIRNFSLLLFTDVMLFVILVNERIVNVGNFVKGKSEKKLTMETGLKPARTILFLELAQKTGWSKAELARALKKSKPYITRRWSGTKES